MRELAARDFRSAVMAIQEADRRLQRPHYTRTTLRRYYQKRLRLEKQDDVAAHLSFCADCRQVLFREVIPSETGRSDATDKVAEAWDLFRSRLRGLFKAVIPIEEYLHHRKLNGDSYFPILSGISRALADLHARGRVLTSLSLEGIQVGSSGEIYLLDRSLFPTVAPGEGAQGEESMVSLYCTLAPEQVSGQPWGPRSNLFSLGTVFYELLTGISPFRDLTSVGTVSRILSLDPVPVRELNRQVDPLISDLTDRLLEKEPENRPKDAVEVLNTLEGRGVSSLPGTPGPDGSQTFNLEEEIDSLYGAIQRLVEGPESASRDREIERAYSRLRELQAVEAARFQESFHASLSMPIDAGATILARARALRKQLEDLAAPDSPSGSTDLP